MCIVVAACYHLILLIILVVAVEKPFTFYKFYSCIIHFENSHSAAFYLQ